MNHYLELAAYAVGFFCSGSLIAIALCKRAAMEPPPIPKTFGTPEGAAEHPGPLVLIGNHQHDGNRGNNFGAPSGASDTPAQCGPCGFVAFPTGNHQHRW